MKKLIFCTILLSTLLSCGKLIDKIREKNGLPTTKSGRFKPVKDFVDEAIDEGYQVEELEGEIYMMDYPLKYEDENRFQRVYLRDWYDEKNQKQTYFINSYVCDYNNTLDLKDILLEAEFGRMGVVCLKKIPDELGGEKEALYVQTAVPVHFINGKYEDLMAVVYEIAADADYLAKKINGKKDLE